MTPGIPDSPARKIKKTYRSVRGSLPSIDGGPSLGYESTLERDFYIILSMDPVVERVLPQPVTLSFLDDSGRKRRYTPDVLVTYQCGRPPAMFEVKYSSELLEDADLYRCRFQAAAAYAAERDMTFAVITEDQIRTGRLQWATFLRPYCFRAPSPELEARLLGALESLGETTPAELLAGFPVHEHGILIPVLWQLVARHRVWMDSEAPVTMQSRLRYRAGT